MNRWSHVSSGAGSVTCTRQVKSYAGVRLFRRTASALDRRLIDARRRRFDVVVVVWRLDRLGRHLRHLMTLLEDLAALGIASVFLNEGIDATTPAGKLHILGANVEAVRRERSGRAAKEVLLVAPERLLTVNFQGYVPLMHRLGGPARCVGPAAKELRVRAV
jgi:hypothetical protein